MTSRRRFPLLTVVLLAAAPVAAPAALLGPLTVHPANPRYFAAPDGRAIWLTGSHTWATLQERGLEGETPDFDYPRFLDFLQQHGHNFLRLWVGSTRSGCSLPRPARPCGTGR